VGPGDTIIEVGPGFGVLTFALVEKAKKVIAFEIEKKLSRYWDEQQEKYPNLNIVWGNVLKEFATHSALFPKTYKVVANLPYHITSNLLRTVLEAEHKPEKVVVMVQKEVAERIVAKPGDMSLLSVSVQYYGVPKIITKVPKGSFWPQPKVDSAVLSIDIYQKETVTDDAFFRIVKAGFSNKRKQLWRNLAEGLHLDKEYVQHILIDLVGSETVRAQELSVDDWKKIVRELGSS